MNKHVYLNVRWFHGYKTNGFTETACSQEYGLWLSRKSLWRFVLDILFSKWCFFCGLQIRSHAWMHKAVCVGFLKCIYLFIWFSTDTSGVVFDTRSKMVMSQGGTAERMKEKVRNTHHTPIGQCLETFRERIKSEDHKILTFDEHLGYSLCLRSGVCIIRCFRELKFKLKKIYAWGM